MNNVTKMCNNIKRLLNEATEDLKEIRKLIDEMADSTDKEEDTEKYCDVNFELTKNISEIETISKEL